jgi:hypothetical protein
MFAETEADASAWVETINRHVKTLSSLHPPGEGRREDSSTEDEIRMKPRNLKLLSQM